MSQSSTSKKPTIKDDFDSENSMSNILTSGNEFTLYKYFVLCVAIFETVSCILTFVDMIKYSKNLVPFYASHIILSLWNAYQLRTLYLSISRKDAALAEKAVKLIKLYMVISALLLLFCINFNPPLTKGRRAVVSQEIYYISQILMILGAELFTGIFFLYGAIKVKASFI